MDIERQTAGVLHSAVKCTSSNSSWTSTPLPLPTRCPTLVIKRNPHLSHPQTLEWDTVEDELVRNIVGKRVHSSLVGIEELTREISKKASETNPYLLEERRIA